MTPSLQAALSMQTNRSNKPCLASGLQKKHSSKQCSAHKLIAATSPASDYENALKTDVTKSYRIQEATFQQLHFNSWRVPLMLEL